jgi:hypothetical protein
MKVKISSSITELFKVIACLFLVLFIVGAVILIMISPDILFVLVLIIIGIIMVLYYIRILLFLKNIELENEKIFISGFNKKLILNLNEVKKVKKEKFLNPPVLTLILKNKSHFGKNISFIPDTYEISEMFLEKVEENK